MTQRVCEQASMTNLTPLVIGPAIGLGLWYYSVNSMEGVGKRLDGSGNENSSNQSLIEYIKLPFSLEKAQYAWATLPEASITDRLKLLSTNWLFMSGLGLGAGILYYKYF